MHIGLLFMTEKYLHLTNGVRTQRMIPFRINVKLVTAVLNCDLKNFSTLIREQLLSFSVTKHHIQNLQTYFALLSVDNDARSMHCYKMRLLRLLNKALINRHNDNDRNV